MVSQSSKKKGEGKQHRKEDSLDSSQEMLRLVAEAGLTPCLYSPLRTMPLTPDFGPVAFITVEDRCCSIVCGRLSGVSGDTRTLQPQGL